MEIYTQVPDQAARDALNRLSDWLDQADDTSDGDTKEPPEEADPGSADPPQSAA